MQCQHHKLTSGDNLPEAKLHYHTIGTAKRNAEGMVVPVIDVTKFTLFPELGFPQFRRQGRESGRLDLAIRLQL